NAEPGEGFKAFNDVLKNAAVKIFAMYSEYTNLTFSQASSNNGDIRLALAEFDATGTGYFPGSPGGRNGDLFLNATDFEVYFLDFVTVMKPGTSGFWTLMHEIGHTLGLSHQFLDFDDPHTGWDYSIMSYASFPGQTPEMEDPPTLFQT